MSSKDFYTQLHEQRLSVSGLLAESQHFRSVPGDWHVVVTDIKGSTELVASVRHETINLIATGSIIAALNIAYAKSIEVPFFFGGDGATLLVPEKLLVEILHALEEHSRNTMHNYAMTLRVGSVQVATVIEQGHSIDIAKLVRNKAFSIPIVIGGGLVFAEKLIKSRHEKRDPIVMDDESNLDLTGMECRWDRIRPPLETGEVVCLLVNVLNQAVSASVLKAVIDYIDDIYGPRPARNPISKERLQLDSSTAAIGKETRVKLGRFDWRYAIEHWFRTAVIGPAFMRYTADGQGYVASVPELSDTLTIDGRINTVIAGTAQQRQQLTAELDRMEATGAILYGLYATSASIMSCYVRNREDQHIHFIDGADGGYTHAATM
ncbi:MAG: DUF3095 family protein, partial [Proteobacteria bacterium]|nr:DUF3095 family protein [Pseudomonadota bacterium]